MLLSIGKLILIVLSKIMSFPRCANQISCAQYLVENPTYGSPSIAFVYNVTVNAGLNTKKNANYVLIKRGSIVVITGKLTIDYSNPNLIYTDYYVKGTSLLPITVSSNSRFYLTTLIRTQYYFNQIDLTHTYSALGTYNVSMWLMQLDYKTMKVIEVKNCN